MSTLHYSHPFPSGLTLEICEGDLTLEPVDAIVNAANEMLIHGGGIARAISRAGGPEIDAQSGAWVREHGPVTHEQPAVTGAGSLPCRCIIHAVGPVWGSGDEDRKLAAAVSGSLSAAAERGLKSIALPAISTGIFGFPRGRAARVILGAVRAWDGLNPAAPLKIVRLTLFDDLAVQDFLAAAYEVLV
jgi:O-acetyl-ADP-ribose deacetylase (regulator of RNase III)